MHPIEGRKEKGFVVIRRIASAVGIAAVGMTLAVAVAGPAYADPYSCHAEVPWLGSSIARAICHNGTGEYRVKARCDRRIWPNYDIYGPWVRVGSWSEASCNGNDDAYSPTVQVR